jgi:hypothetical protein
MTVDSRMEDSLENPQLDQTLSPILTRIRWFSYALDRSIPVPGTQFRFGLDPILGLVPVAGDILGAIASLYILLEAARFHLPRITLIRMVLNILCETVIGIIPVVGNLFDAAWKANTRNLALLEAHIEHPTESRAADRWFFLGLLLAVGLVLLAILAFGSLLFWALLRLISG